MSRHRAQTSPPQQPGHGTCELQPKLLQRVIGGLSRDPIVGLVLRGYKEFSLDYSSSGFEISVAYGLHRVVLGLGLFGCRALISVSWGPYGVLEEVLSARSERSQGHIAWRYLCPSRTSR